MATSSTTGMAKFGLGFKRAGLNVATRYPSIIDVALDAHAIRSATYSLFLDNEGQLC